MTVVIDVPSVELGALWRRLRTPVVGGVIALGALIALAVLGATPGGGALDPRDAGPAGARALAVLLADRGVDIHVATTVPGLQPAPETTILLSQPGQVSVRALRTVLATTATVVLVDPPPPLLAATGLRVTADAKASGETIDAGCSLPAAVTAGSVRLSGTLYAVAGATTACYREGGDAALVVATRSDGGRTVILGSGSTLSNADLAKAGDAALAIGLLDAPQLRWVPAGLNDGAPPASQRGFVNLLPNRVVAAAVQLAIAVIVLALWRARRLGKPVAEPLPVIVRAAETVEGRARLLRAAHSRGTAATALRSASIRRLTHALRLGHDEDPATVIAVVAEAAHSPAATVQAVLYGDDPTDDASLVSLGQQLPDLEAAVRADTPPPSGST